jgi:uncharacterized membrane-anchored protein
MKSITAKTKSGFSKAGSVISGVRMEVNNRHLQPHGQRLQAKLIVRQIMLRLTKK